MNPKRRVLQKAGTWANLSIIGIQFPVAIVIGYFWGKGMDKVFHTYPWLTVIFSLFGIAAGFVNLFRITARAAREEDAEAAANRERQASEEPGHDPEREP